MQNHIYLYSNVPAFLTFFTAFFKAGGGFGDYSPVSLFLPISELSLNERKKKGI